MYKNWTLAFLSIAVLNFASAKESPVQPTPIVVEAKASQPIHNHHHPKRSKTPEKFKKEVETKITKLKAKKDKIQGLKDKVESQDQLRFDLNLRCADKWIETLGQYESTDTRIDRSFRFANSELTSAQNMTKLKPSHATKGVYPEKDIEKLESRFTEVKAHADKLTGDNRKAFDAMIFCGNEYISVLKLSKDHPVSVRRLLSQAMKYVNTAEVFAHRRIEHVSQGKSSEPTLPPTQEEMKPAVKNETKAS